MCVLHACFVLSGCYTSVSTQRSGGVNKKKSWSRYARSGIFSACNREQLCKMSPPFDKDKGEVRVKGKKLTHLYRRWGQLCSCIGGYCCSQILLSLVHIWWMNHLAIGQAGLHCLCNKQKGFLHTVTTSASAMRKAFTSFPFINSLEQEIIQMPLRATKIITSCNLRTPGCSICCLCAALTK